MKIKIFLLLVSILLLFTSCNTSYDNQNIIHEKVTQLETSPKENVQEKLKRMVQENTEQPVCAFYDITGSNEEDSYAFVFTGEIIEEIGNTIFQGALWYADGQACILLMDKIETSSFEPAIIEENNHLLLKVSSNLPGDAKTYIWAVNDHRPQLVLETFNSCFIDNGLLALVKTSINNSVGGRIWQRYYLYWDSDSQSYQSYDGREISEAEFLSYENAQAVRDEVEAAIIEDSRQSLSKTDLNDGSHFEYNYIKCDNGIIYVNYVITIDSEILYYYSILMEKNGKVVMEERPHYDMYEKGYMLQSDEYDR